jgi:hypothetical protein
VASGWPDFTDQSKDIALRFTVLTKIRSAKTIHLQKVVCLTLRAPQESLRRNQQKNIPQLQIRCWKSRTKFHQRLMLHQKPVTPGAR